jgi:asparagine synthase (glutamine-hydrolysing)
MDGESLLYQYLRPSAVQKLLREHQSGQSDHHKVLFSLVLFEQWLRIRRASAARIERDAVPTR